MSENNAFAKALHNFTMDAACSDAIRHLTDKGFMPSQIKDTLTFPAPMGHIVTVMWERLVETHKIVPDENGPLTPSPGTTGFTYETIERRDEYGRRSFLRVKKESPEEMIFSPEDYVLCDYGRRIAKGEKFDNELIALLPWPGKPVWVHSSLLKGSGQK